MNLINVTMDDFETVLNIAQRGVAESFSKYYPKGAVDYFFYHHGSERVSKSIEAGDTYLLYNEDNIAVGTVSVTGDEIHRFFVLPEYQGKGYGTYMLDICEKQVLDKYPKVRVDASLGAFNMYLHRGYIMDDFIAYPQDNGDFLCYMPMSKGK